MAGSVTLRPWRPRRAAAAGCTSVSCGQEHMDRVSVSDSEVARRVIVGGWAVWRPGRRVAGGQAERWRAGALHLSDDLLVRSLERQVAAAAAAVVHRMPWCLRHLSNGEVYFCASCVWVCERGDEAQRKARAQLQARAQV